LPQIREKNEDIFKKSILHHAHLGSYLPLASIFLHINERRTNTYTTCKARKAAPLSIQPYTLASLPAIFPPKTVLQRCKNAGDRLQVAYLQQALCHFLPHKKGLHFFATQRRHTSVAYSFACKAFSVPCHFSYKRMFFTLVLVKAPEGRPVKFFWKT
jgi:hypothetical protein